jgi:putative oxidoreductase
MPVSGRNKGPEPPWVTVHFSDGGENNGSDMPLSRTYAPLLGRVLLSFIFLQSAYDKIFNFSKTAALMASKNMPMPEPLLVPIIVVLLGGGLTILTGWRARWGALALFLFLIPATLIFHDYWACPAAQQINQPVPSFRHESRADGRIAHDPRPGLGSAESFPENDLTGRGMARFRSKRFDSICSMRLHTLRG